MCSHGHIAPQEPRWRRNAERFVYRWLSNAMKLVRTCVAPAILSIVLAMSGLLAWAVDEDSATLSERGILNWLHYQKILLADNVHTVVIDQNGIQPADVEVILASRRVHGTLIIENAGNENHRIVFDKHIGNNLGYAINSPVIKPGERWAVDIMKDGIYPFHCSLHPDKIQGTLQVWYEEEEF